VEQRGNLLKRLCPFINRGREHGQTAGEIIFLLAVLFFRLPDEPHGEPQQFITEVIEVLPLWLHHSPFDKSFWPNVRNALTIENLTSSLLTLLNDSIPICRRFFIGKVMHPTGI
jgi:hypothetical protein